MFKSGFRTLITEVGGPRRLANWAAAGVLAASFASNAVAADNKVPTGPYQLRHLELHYVFVTFAKEAVDAMLPSNIQPMDDYSGGIDAYAATEGWGIAPFSATYIYVNVKGHDTPDGAPGRYTLAAFFSDPAYTALHGAFPDLVKGEARITTEGGDIVGTGGPTGQDLIRIRLKQPDMSKCTPAAGVSHYLAGTRAAATILNPVPYALNFCPTDAVSAEIMAPEGSALATLKPTKITGAFVGTDTSVVLGLVQPLD